MHWTTTVCFRVGNVNMKRSMMNTTSGCWKMCQNYLFTVSAKSHNAVRGLFGVQNPAKIKAKVLYKKLSFLSLQGDISASKLLVSKQCARTAWWDLAKIASKPLARVQFDRLLAIQKAMHLTCNGLIYIRTEEVYDNQSILINIIISLGKKNILLLFLIHTWMAVFIWVILTLCQRLINLYSSD